MSKIAQLKPGIHYSNEDICEIFLCAPQGGMRRSKRTNTLTLIADHTKSIYDDRWENQNWFHDGVLNYTGMGRQGNQVLDGNQNITLFESDNNGIEVHLFEVLRPRIYTYKGQVQLADKPFLEKQDDVDGSPRDVWVFPLKVIDSSSIETNDQEQANSDVVDEVSEVNLKSISLKSFVENYDVPIRVRNAIVSESNYFDLGSVHDFVNNNNDYADFIRMPNFGKGSLEQLVQLVNEFVEKNIVIEDALQDSFEERDNSSIKKYVDTDLEKSLSQTQSKALKAIKIGFFTSNSQILSVRTRNCLFVGIEDNKLDHFENLYDLYVAHKIIKSRLLEIPNFGRHSLVNLNDALNSLINNETLLFEYVKSCNQVPETIYDFESIEELLEIIISTFINTREKEVIKYRKLTKKKLTLEELGARFKVTRERIRQVEKTVLYKMKRRILLRFSEDELKDWSKAHFNDFFFSENSFISLKTAKACLKNEPEPTSIQLFIPILSNTLINFLNEYYIFSENYNGWFIDEEHCEESLIENDDVGLDLKEAFKNAHWPINLSEVANLMCLPESVAKDKVLLSKEFFIKSIEGKSYIHIKNIKINDAVRLVLKRYGRAMTIYEVKDNCYEMFKRKISLGNINNALGTLPDGLIVDRGTYILYENLDVNNKQLANVKKFSKNYLLKTQQYTSALVIFEELNKDVHKMAKYGKVDRGHVLFGICQDDDRFITRRGYMLGLKGSNFEAKFISFTQEVINLLKSEGKPMTTKEIMAKLNQTRKPLESGLFGMLDANKEVFENINGKFILKGQTAHLKINLDDLIDFG